MSPNCILTSWRVRNNPRLRQFGSGLAVLGANNALYIMSAAYGHLPEKALRNNAKREKFAVYLLQRGQSTSHGMPHSPTL